MTAAVVGYDPRQALEQDAAPGLVATPTTSGASPEGDDGGTGAATCPTCGTTEVEYVRVKTMGDAEAGEIVGQWRCINEHVCISFLKPGQNAIALGRSLATAYGRTARAAENEATVEVSGEGPPPTPPPSQSAARQALAASDREAGQ